ncbi:hypothetical protein SCATT_05370 [Streptantibioticus cattleyicolor NRRL 8057 = DSM 46488]|uniref:Uncharacterized protein n=1 Tax=Streptantibioticus cattleyicolor (strain ATCC 35852 / DSM 46488 / JCM 4925 / NBRC 14057 / NRRL 8057) TaxID=1003195 RepID=F8JRZ7_STREN|nr:hypothetical protein SCATT_05370 [Streptantibioticus cattleyicolor NRRL 8057 = DSM 46488]MYS57658.1 hypothetical protein [Streptomyces sp. SID5468]CCB73265.1 protein of unknown function [Streptantibioticus cattleyicolor NRRL 8057 = DSM 46488]
MDSDADVFVLHDVPNWPQEDLDCLARSGYRLERAVMTDRPGYHTLLLCRPPWYTRGVWNLAGRHFHPGLVRMRLIHLPPDPGQDLYGISGLRPAEEGAEVLLMALHMSERGRRLMRRATAAPGLAGGELVAAVEQLSVQAEAEHGPDWARWPEPPHTRPAGQPVDPTFGLHDPAAPRVLILSHCTTDDDTGPETADQVVISGAASSTVHCPPAPTSADDQMCLVDLEIPR